MGIAVVRRAAGLALIAAVVLGLWACTDGPDAAVRAAGPTVEVVHIDCGPRRPAVRQVRVVEVDVEPPGGRVDVSLTGRLEPDLTDALFLLRTQGRRDQTVFLAGGRVRDRSGLMPGHWPCR